MFERFTERARQVVVLAQEEARELKHNYIGTEHLLLGLLREGDGVAARVLDTVVGRQMEIERVMQILSRRTKNNPVLIGEPGVGKTAVVEGLAQLVADN